MLKIDRNRHADSLLGTPIYSLENACLNSASQPWNYKRWMSGLQVTLLSGLHLVYLAKVGSNCNIDQVIPKKEICCDDVGMWPPLVVKPWCQVSIDLICHCTQAARWVEHNIEGRGCQLCHGSPQSRIMLLGVVHALLQEVLEPAGGLLVAPRLWQWAPQPSRVCNVCNLEDSSLLGCDTMMLGE